MESLPDLIEKAERERMELLQCIGRRVLPGAGRKRVSGSSEPGSSSSKYIAEGDTTPVKAIPYKSKGRG